MKRHWIKLHTGNLDDPRIAQLPDRLWRRYTEFMLLAARADESGALPSLQDCAWYLRCDYEALNKEAEELKRRGLLGFNGQQWYVIGFEEKQDADTPAERARNYRAALHGGVTKRDEKRHENKKMGDTESESEEESESESDKESEEEAERRAAPAAAAETPAFGRSFFDQVPETAVAPLIYADVTGQMAIPATDAQGVIDAIMAIYVRNGRDRPKTAAALRPFWEEWRSRKTAAGRGYSPINPKWLTDWAACGVIPPKPADQPNAPPGKNGNGNGSGRKSALQQLTELEKALKKPGGMVIDG